MSHYRPYPLPAPLVRGYDPYYDLPEDHLARLIEQVVEATLIPPLRDQGRGQRPYDPRLCVKVLIYGYCTGIRSSRRLEQACRESLPFLFLTRGDTPSYRTLCTVRVTEGQFLEDVWTGLLAVAATVGLPRLGRIVVDSTKLRSDSSPESVVAQQDYAAVRAELQRILDEAAATDEQEEGSGGPAERQLRQVVPQEHMREILRRVHRQTRKAGAAAGAPPAGADDAPGGPELPSPGDPAADPAAEVEPMTPQMLARVAAGIRALDTATAEGLKHVTLTDPDARMMYGGHPRRTEECHSWEVAVDGGLLVAAETTQSGNDNERLEPLVTAAAANEPEGVKAATGDSGYYRGDVVAALALQGIDTCVPDSNTAADLHRGQPVGTTRDRSRGTVAFTWDPEAGVFRCPEGNTLAPTQVRQEGGQQVTVFRAVAPCTGCPLAAACLSRTNAQHRTLRVGQHQEVLDGLRERFNTLEHQERYRHRGEAVETVFGFLRGVLGYTRWMLRGAARVAREGQLFAAAYQFRKVHVAWRTA